MHALGVVRSPDRVGLPTALRRILVVVACALTPVVLLATFLSPAFDDSPNRVDGRDAFGFDFRPTWDAAGRILHGDPVYPPASSAVLAKEDQYVYPPAPAVAAIALRPLGFELASFVVALILVGAILLTLRLLAVRDWRCYAVALLALPVLDGARLGAVSALLALAAAAAWRYRESVWAVALAVGGALAIKLFLWPLVLWLILTRRLRHAFAAIAFASAATLFAWYLAGFSGMRAYPALLAALTDAVGGRSYSVYALGLAIGLPEGFAEGLVLGFGVVVVGVAIALTRRSSFRATERALFVAGLGAALVFSPIVWTHYFALVLIPIAMASPSLGSLWLLPLAFWVSPHPSSTGEWTNQSDGELWRILVALIVAAVPFAAALEARLPARSTFRRVVGPVEKTTHSFG